ncbi:hypothetical protein ZWY2020_044407 [Hordeum vulgare]|nr:hypothetical protein ZWY2020_044407 [Hordeum vulgare]
MQPSRIRFTAHSVPKNLPATSRASGKTVSLSATPPLPSTTPYRPADASHPKTCSQMWPKLVAEAKGDGADCIETYFFLKLDKGIVSGINAARHSDGKPLIVLERESRF